LFLKVLVSIRPTTEVNRTRSRPKRIPRHPPRKPSQNPRQVLKQAHRRRPPQKPPIQNPHLLNRPRKPKAKERERKRSSGYFTLERTSVTTQPIKGAGTLRAVRRQKVQARSAVPSAVKRCRHAPPSKVAGTLRRAVRRQGFAKILGGRHMECAYYFVDGTWNVPTTLTFVGCVNQWLGPKSRPWMERGKKPHSTLQQFTQK